jgi:hypothetical protein
MKSGFFILFCVLSLTVQGQRLEQYNEQMYRYNKNGWLTVGGWSVANIGVGTAGILTAKTEQTKAFHQMNIMVNVVNIGFTIPGLITAMRNDPACFDPKQTYQAQLRQEKVYLFNAGLDLFYMAGGLFLRSSSQNETEWSPQLKGFGNSILIQGAFLFCVDLSMTLLHRRHRLKTLDPMLQMSSGPNGIGLKLNL